MSSYATAMFGLAGVVVGALLQFLLANRVDRSRHLREKQALAYSDYLKSVAEMTHFQMQLNQRDDAKLFAALADAKARICIYGSAEVVSKLARFEQLGAQIVTDAQVSLFREMILSMREGANGSVAFMDGESIDIVLLGKSKS